MSRLGNYGSTSASNQNYNAFKGPQVGINSGSSIENGYLEFFGNPLKAPQNTDEDGHFHTHEDLPELYRGRNKVLSTVVEGLVSQAPTFINSYALPMQFTNEVTFKWVEYTFDQGFVEQVPHEGIPRMLRHTSKSRQEQSSRHAVAVYFEYDFFMSDAGREMYAMEIIQVKCNVKNTMAYDGIVTIRNCHREEDMFLEQYGLTSLTPDARLNAEYEQYGMIQKNAKGLELMDGKFKELAGLAPFVPNMYIAPLGLRRYVTIVPDKRTLYMYAGPGGVRRMMEGPEAMGDIRGTPVYEIPNFKTYNDVAGDVNALHIMENQTSHGEFFISLACDFADIKNEQYLSKMRNLWIYDQKKDRIIEFPFSKIVSDSILPEDNDTMRGMSTTKEWAGILSNARPQASAGKWTEEERNKIKDKLKLMVSNDEKIPLSYIIQRPWQEDIMADVILMKGGPETGNTFWGHSNFKLAENATLKTIFGNYTYYCKCVIRKPKNILIAKNVFYRGYKRGAGTETFTEDELKDLGSKFFKFHNLEDERTKAKSLIILTMNDTMTEQNFDKFIDITGSFEDQDGDDNYDEHYPGARAYMRQFEWTSMIKNKRGLAFQTNFSEANSICARGFSQSWAHGNAKGKVILCQGAHGDVMYDGIGRIRSGLDQEYDLRRAITK